MKGPRHIWAGDWRSESRYRARPAAPVSPHEIADEHPGDEVIAAPAGRFPRSKWVVICAAIGAVALGGAYLAGGELGGDSSNAPVALPAATAPAITPPPGQTQAGAIYAKASPAVVSVRTSSGSGTGFVVNTDGTIVTNSHVVASDRTVTVRFGADGPPVSADVIGTDPSSDLATLRIAASAIPSGVSPLRFADSDQVAVGDSVLAIGNPFGLDRTQTAGIVSGVGRDIQAPNGFQIFDAIQTDAAINPGNSGGPLLDSSGLVIGVNAQIETSGISSGNVGIGFAVPSNSVRQIVPVLKQGRSIERAWLGVSTADPGVGQGARVAAVTPKGPAAKAGLLPGDLITAIGSKPVTGSVAVGSLVGAAKAGDDITIKVQRNGRSLEFRATLEPRPQGAP